MFNKDLFLSPSTLAGRSEWTNVAGSTMWTTIPGPPHGRGPQLSLCATTSSGRASATSCRAPCTSSASASSTRYWLYCPQLCGSMCHSKVPSDRKEPDWLALLVRRDKMMLMVTSIKEKFLMMVVGDEVKGE